MDKVKFELWEDGSIDLDFSNADGHLAYIYPRMDGRTEIEYKVRMDRKVTVKNGRTCDKVELCNVFLKNEKKGAAGEAAAAH